MMKLEAYHVGDGACMAHAQSQLVALRIQFSEIMKEKEKHKQVWCITCKTEGHQKEEYPVFAQYMVTGSAKPLAGGVIYCEI
jgi:hypothetical protein